MNKQEILKDEVLMIEKSGEMPEVAFYESLYFLRDDPEGPGFYLDEYDQLPLKKAVIRRYTSIILRDLNPRNRKKSIYRGLKRSIINWDRLKKYSGKENLDIEEVRKKTADSLIFFLKQEWHDVTEKKAESCLNCSRIELEKFAVDLGLKKEQLLKRFSNFTALYS